MHYTAQKVWDYCWINGNVFKSLNRTSFTENTHRLVVADFNDTVTPGELVFWRMYIERLSDQQSEKIGGSNIYIIIRGPSLNRPKIFDMRNGTYLAAFRILDPGLYTATVSLRWQNCRGYVFCSENDLEQPIHFTRSYFFHVLNLSSSMASISIFPYHGSGNGRWVSRDTHENSANTSVGSHALLEDAYRWRPWLNQEPMNQITFPTSKLKNRFIYFIGDSLTSYAFQQLSRQILPQDKAFHTFISRDNGSVMSKYIAGRSMELWHYGDLNLTLAYSWYPESYPVGGRASTNFPLVDQEEGSVHEVTIAHFHVSTWMSFLRSYIKEQSFSVSNNPDAVIFNFGLHFVTQIDPPIYEILLRNMLLNLRSEFPETETKLIWRSTAYTHFDTEKLANGWNCRCYGRVEVLNEVAAGLISSLNVTVLDFAEISAARADAAPDNRHYSKGNVRATYNNILLRYLDNHLRN